jgi:hypothetical protein
VIFRTGLPRAIFRKGMTRTCNHAPAGSREALDGRMADAATRSREEQRTARLVCL